MLVNSLIPQTLELDRLVAFADGEGMFLVKNHKLKKMLKIDFSAWWYPSREIQSIEED